MLVHCCRNVLHKSNVNRQTSRREGMLPLHLSCLQRDRHGKWLSEGLRNWRHKWPVSAHQHRGWNRNKGAEDNRPLQCSQDPYRWGQ